jgi:hypothetical protein
LIKEVEARATLAEREAQERVLKMKVKSTTSLAFVHGEADELTRKVAVMEGELEDAHQSQDTTEVNFQGLFDKVADVNFQQLTLLQTTGVRVVPG